MYWLLLFLTNSQIYDAAFSVISESQRQSFGYLSPLLIVIKIKIIIKFNATLNYIQSTKFGAPT